MEISRKGEKPCQDYAGNLLMQSEKLFEPLLDTVLGKKKSLEEKLTAIEAEALICKACKQTCETTIQSYQPIVQPQPRNGTEAIIKTARDLIQNAKDIVEKQTQKFQTLIEELKSDLDAALEDFRNITEKLVKEVKHWQHELQLKYAELYANVDLQSFAPYCAKTGELLRDVLCTDIPRLENAVNASTLSEDVDFVQVLHAQFSSLLASFYQRTFVVVSQEGSQKHDPWNIKKGSGVTASTPKITLRILGADTFEGLGGVQVHACFVKESLINSCYDCDAEILNTDGLEEKGWKTEKPGKATKFVYQRSSAVYEATLNVEVHVNLKRSKDVPVFKEKYRLVFYTQLKNEKYWTLSLPMVVTTGGIQQCQCLASVMWQCYNTDVFALPNQTLPDLPWSSIEEMLQTKLRNISSHKLTKDNIAHLKERLLGTSRDDAEISLYQFCTIPLANSEDDQGKEFSFWKWFLSIYNLIKTYLRDQWEKGWIEGFLSKEMAERKLKESKDYKPGLFLLRFSDLSLDSTQTKDSVFGRVASSVLVRNRRKQKEVKHVDRIGHDRLSKEGLLHILSLTNDKKGKSLYKYLYPNMEKTWEQLLEGYVIPAPVVSGYLGVQNAYIADLEKIDDQLSKLGLGETRTNSSSMEIDTDTDADDDDGTVSQTATDPKKLKTSITNSTISVSELQDKDNGASEDYTIVTEEIYKTFQPAIVHGKDSSTNVASVLKQLLTGPIPARENNVYEIQFEKGIAASHASANTSFGAVGPSAQNDLANATNCFPAMIHVFDSEDNVAETVSVSMATVIQSGDTLLNSVGQNQAVLVQGTDGSQNVTQQDKCNFVYFPDTTNIPNVTTEDMQMPVTTAKAGWAPRMIQQGHCDTTYQPDMIDNLTFTTYPGKDGAGIQLPAAGNQVTSLKTTENMTEENLLSSLLEEKDQSDITQHVVTNAENQQNANGQTLAQMLGENNCIDTETLGSYYGEEQMYENQSATEVHTSDPSQIFDPETAGNQTFAPETQSGNDQYTVQCIQEFVNEQFKDILDPYYQIPEKISVVSVQSQTDTTTETINVVMEPSEDVMMMEYVKSYIEKLPAEQLMTVIPKEKVIELNALYFQQLTKMEFLTPSLEKLPKDLKQRVIQALQESMNESQS